MSKTVQNLKYSMYITSDLENRQIFEKEKVAPEQLMQFAFLKKKSQTMNQLSKFLLVNFCWMTNWLVK